MTPATRILIVDDDVPTRIGLRTILSLEPDLEVVGEATSGTDACAMADELRPDIVLMDIHLPGLDGIEATRLILDRSSDAGAEVATTPRVIVLTTFDVDGYVHRSLRAGASGFLLKRTRAEDIVDAVRAVAAGTSLPMPSRTIALVSRFSEAAESTRPETSLTGRELDVLLLIAEGLSNQEIAERLHVSGETVRTHVKRVYAKTGARDRVHVVIAAYESGLVQRRRL